MPDEKQSISGNIDVGAYDRSFAESAKKAGEGIPVVGSVAKTIADTYHNFATADDFGDFAGAAGSLVGDGAGFVAECGVDIASFVMDPVN